MSALKWIAFIAAATFIAWFAKNAEAVPVEAHKYRHQIIVDSYRVWGLGGLDHVSRFAGQIHQESYWNPLAKSKYAAGLSQFTPATAEWISGKYKELESNDVLSPKWAIAALVRYDHFLYARADGSAECDRWAFALSGYNGGETWRKRDQALCAGQDHGDHCDPERWFGNVEHHSNRANWAIKENRGYVERILTDLEHRYVSAGWNGEAVCDQPRKKK